MTSFPFAKAPFKPDDFYPRKIPGGSLAAVSDDIYQLLYEIGYSPSHTNVVHAIDLWQKGDSPGTFTDYFTFGWLEGRT